MASGELAPALSEDLDEKHAQHNGETQAAPVNGAPHEGNTDAAEEQEAQTKNDDGSYSAKPDTNGGASHDEKSEQNHPAANGDKSKEDAHDDANPDKQHQSLPQRAESELGGLKDKLTDQKQRIKDKKAPPGGFDKTSLPDIPPGYTIKITFHGASNLPAADLTSGTSDPFLTATIKTALPRRHDDDPPLIHRTRTIHKSRAPRWDDEWIVANVPAGGFTMKCRLYDEDTTDHDDRLGNVTIHVPRLDEKWGGIGVAGKGQNGAEVIGHDGQDGAQTNGEPGQQKHEHDGKDVQHWPGATFDVKKRSGSKRAYFFRAIHSGLSHSTHMTPQLHISIEMLGKSEGPGAHMYTVGPTRWIKHYSPMIGRIAGTKVNKDEEHDSRPSEEGNEKGKTKKYDFQSNELQLEGPVPPKLYHRYVEFRPVIGKMFANHGVRGWILNKALHKQHSRIYHYQPSTETGVFKPCSTEASLQFLRLAHFDEGGRIFTYVLTLDGLLRFTETGKEFGIDLLSKHTMHSDVATYIACSGEFFIRRLNHHESDQAERDNPEPSQPTHPDQDVPGGPPHSPPPQDPAQYQLVIDNDSGTYRPDKSILPLLKEFLEKNFPGLGVVAMHWQEEELEKLKKQQQEIKKREGQGVNMVLNRNASSESFSSDDESRLGDLEDDAAAGEGGEEAARKHKSPSDLARGKLGARSKKEAAYDVLENPMAAMGLVGHSK